jgi:Domain of unknown function (DUF4351)/Putative transposase, YhgA-like
MDYIDHDELFKKLLTTFFVEFVELFLPDVAEYLDPEGITFLPQEYFNETQTGERRKIDILVQARFRGQETFFLIHVENQSYDEDYFDRRLFFYFALLYQKYLLPIYPIAVFSFDYPLRPQSQQHEVRFPDFKVLEFNFASVQLNNLSWRDFLQHQNPVAAALMSKMRVARKDRPKVKAECLRLLATLELDPVRTELISGFVDTYLKLNAKEEEVFQEEIDRIGIAEQEKVMEIVTSWMERGIERGELKLLLKQLNRRFNGLNPSLEEQVRQLPVEQVEALGEDMMDFSGEVDLVNWLAQVQIRLIES